MIAYMAPLEGLTTYIYRNAWHRHFLPLDKYFTPFIVPASKRPLRTRELKDVAPEHNAGLPVVPQILTNDPERFLEACHALKDLGYEEVNLNLGCPSGTVTSGGKGAGFLRDPAALSAFFTRVFSEIPVRLSVKTRLGWEDPVEFSALLPVFNAFPLTELILHPRVRREFYTGQPHREAYREALSASLHPVIYNGNLFTPEDVRALTEDCPRTQGIMLGRGLLASPGLWNALQGEPVTKETLRSFHDEIYLGYRSSLSGPDPVLHKMKELWGYMLFSFTRPERHEKAMRKAHRLSEYEQVVQAIFREEELSREGFRPPAGRHS